MQRIKIHRILTRHGNDLYSYSHDQLNNAPYLDYFYTVEQKKFKNICSEGALHFLADWEQEDADRYINTRSKCLGLMQPELLSELSRKAYLAGEVDVQKQFDTQIKMRRSEIRGNKGISADDIKATVSITDLVGQYAGSSRLRPGSLIKCPLPDHADGTPSFLLVERKGLFVCYGCGKKGSVIDFVMEMEGCDFKEALKRLSGHL